MGILRFFFFSYSVDLDNILVWLQSCLDLVYIDPPFASGANYAKQVYVRRNPKVAEAIVEAENELDIEDLKKFEEEMYGDVWDKEKYLN